MEHEDIPIKPYATKFGLIFGGASILVLVLLSVFNIEQNTGISILNLVVNAVIVFFAIHLYKNDNSGQLNFSTSIKIGLAIGAIGGLLYAVYSYVHFSFIDTAFIEDLKAETLAAVETEINKQKMPSEQADMTKSVALLFTSPFVIATMGLISVMLKTLFISLFVGLIKKN